MVALHSSRQAGERPQRYFLIRLREMSRPRANGRKAAVEGSGTEPEPDAGARSSSEGTSVFCVRVWLIKSI